MRLGDKTVVCLLDTGCDVTPVPQSVVSATRGLKVTPCVEYLEAANGTQIAVTGNVTVPFRLNERRINTRASVSSDVDETMLGADWLGEHRCVWDFVKSTITIDGSPPIPLIKRHTLRCRRVILQGDVVLPPRQQADVVARTTFSSRSQFLLGDYVVDSHRVRPGVYVGHTLVPSGKLYNQKVRVVNATSKPQRLYNGFGLGNMSAAEVISPDGFGGAHLDSVESATQCDAPPQDPVARTSGTGDAPAPVKVTQGLIDGLPDDLTDHQRNQVVDLVD